MYILPEKQDETTRTLIKLMVAFDDKYNIDAKKNLDFNDKKHQMNIRYEILDLLHQLYASI